MNEENRKAMYADRWGKARLAKKHQIKRLQNDAIDTAHRRVLVMHAGVAPKSTPSEDKARIKQLWEHEKKVHINIARLQGRKLREGFAES